MNVAVLNPRTIIYVSIRRLSRHRSQMVLIPLTSFHFPPVASISLITSMPFSTCTRPLKTYSKGEGRKVKSLWQLAEKQASEKSYSFYY